MQITRFLTSHRRRYKKRKKYCQITAENNIKYIFKNKRITQKSKLQAFKTNI